VYPTGISLRVFHTDYAIPRANVRRVRLVGPAMGPPGFHGIVVEHDYPQVPPYVLFWSFDRRALVSALLAEGYQVS